MTLITRVPGVPDPTLPLVIPSFGLTDITHFYHPTDWVDDGANWNDAVGSIPLPISGDDSITGITDNDRPIVRLTTTASFFPGAIFPAADLGTVMVIAKVGTADAHGGTAGYVIHNRTSGIALNTTGSGAVSFTNGGAGTTIALDKYHLFTITTPGTLISTFTIDDYTTTASSAGSSAQDTIRVGGNSTTNHKAMSVAAVLSTETLLSSAVITGSVFPLVKDWWPELDWV